MIYVSYDVGYHFSLPLTPSHSVTASEENFDGLRTKGVSSSIGSGERFSNPSLSQSVSQSVRFSFLE